MSPGMCMMEHYSDAKASVKMLIRFLKGFSAPCTGALAKAIEKRKE
jgi:hypothetical protein